MTEIYFIRHGQASFGSDDYDCLSDLGIRQAELLGDYFARIDIHFHAIYSGSLKRQIDTAKIVTKQLEHGSRPVLCITDKFDEFDAEAMIVSQMDDMVREDPSLATAAASFASDFDAYKLMFDRAIQRIMDGRNNESNSLEEFINAIRKGIDQVVQANGTSKKVAVFTSGGTISAIMQLALNLPLEETVRLGWEIFNTSVSIFNYRKDRLNLKAFNSVSHLELHQDPNLITYL
ncbi:MAG: histidine phosphatase family protein [Deltaproteobacteria bacterium]|nr:histidine phosphatase family protein [Deltaproteobacteria bacterium]